MSGAKERYYFRQAKWTQACKLFPKIRHHSWWLLHNCLSHPLLGIYPAEETIWFHDWTSKHLNLRTEQRSSPTPNITNNKMWVYHNVVGHLAIGLFPTTNAFKFHDYTAEAMMVEDWI